MTMFRHELKPQADAVGLGKREWGSASDSAKTEHEIWTRPLPLMDLHNDQNVGRGIVIALLASAPFWVLLGWWVTR